MYFESLQALLVMDGHGVFVWSAYAVTAATVGLILIAPARRRRRILRQLHGELKRTRGDAAVDPGEGS